MLIIDNKDKFDRIMMLINKEIESYSPEFISTDNLIKLIDITQVRNNMLTYGKQKGFICFW